ncbi:hypothetical protein BJX65DRAFT_272614 [Aspergillus insuetus]
MGHQVLFWRIRERDGCEDEGPERTRKALPGKIQQVEYNRLEQFNSPRLPRIHQRKGWQSGGFVN